MLKTGAALYSCGNHDKKNRILWWKSSISLKLEIFCNIITFSVVILNNVLCVSEQK